MPGAMRCSHWLALPAKTISMLPTSPRHRPDRRPKNRQPSRKVQLNGGRSHLPHRGEPPTKSGPEANPWNRRRRPHCANNSLANSKTIGSADDAALWAHRALSDKNSLTAADARLLEDAFQVRLTTLESAADLEMHHCRRLYPRSSPLRQLSGEAKYLSEDIPCRRHRQEPVGPSRAAPRSRQGARQVRGQAALPGLRPQTLGRPSPAVRATPRTRTQSER